MRFRGNFIILLLVLLPVSEAVAEDVSVSRVTLYDEDGEEHTFRSVRDRKYGKEVLYLLDDDEILKRIDPGESESKPQDTMTSPNNYQSPLNPTDYKEIIKEFNAEPDVTDVQQMAIDYANVNPSQIKSWHKHAAAKAFLPSLSVGFSRGDGDIYHWDTGPNPDVLTKGRDYLDWSTSVSWDFGDFLWSSDRTSIDSRSKLMSELRQDIMDQVTRIYFERRRIQVEIATNTQLASNSQSFLKIDELTALLDGFTGGEFSRRIQISPEYKQNQQKE